MSDTDSRQVNDSHPTEAEDEQTIRLREEQLQVQKTAVEKGRVNVRKEVITENQTIEVPVSKEKVIIEHRPVSAQDAGEVGEVEEEEFSIPIIEEQVIVTKRPVVTEEVVIGKTNQQTTQQVQDTVRKEKLRVDEESAQ